MFYQPLWRKRSKTDIKYKPSFCVRTRIPTYKIILSNHAYTKKRKGLEDGQAKRLKFNESAGTPVTPQKNPL